MLRLSSLVYYSLTQAHGYTKQHFHGTCRATTGTMQPRCQGRTSGRPRRLRAEQSHGHTAHEQARGERSNIQIPRRPQFKTFILGTFTLVNLFLPSYHHNKAHVGSIPSLSQCRNIEGLRSMEIFQEKRTASAGLAPNIVWYRNNFLANPCVHKTSSSIYHVMSFFCLSNTVNELYWHGNK